MGQTILVVFRQMIKKPYCQDFSLQLEQYMQKKYSKMGNQNMFVCNTSKFASKQLVDKNTIQAGQKKRKSVDSTGSENIGDADEEIDECSPASKFDIRFLATSIRASYIKQQLNSKLSKQNIKTSTRGDKNQQMECEKETKKLCNEINTINTSTLQVHQKHFNITLNGQKQGEGEDEDEKKNKSNEKKGVSKKWLHYMEQISSPLTEMIISGQNFYKIRQEPIEPFYYFLKKIGEGSFGSVYKGKCMKSGQLRAIKILKKKIMNSKDEQALISQINILKKMDHINIIKLYDVFYFKNFFYVVTEYCDGGNLLSALQKQQIRSQKDILQLMKQILSAVTYMHQKNIAHRDLKLENIVLIKQMTKSSTDKACIKLIDFGLAQITSNPQKNKTGIVGTVSYMPPEIFSGYFSCKSDVWSCGIIMSMLFIGYNPFKRKKQAHTIHAIQNEHLNYHERQWQRISTKAKSLLNLMLEKDPEKRISPQKILTHEWARSYRMTQKKQTSLSQDHSSDAVISNFNRYHRGNNFICYVKNFLISRQLTQSLRQEMAQIFQKIDSDCSGVIQKQQLLQLYSLISGTTSAQMQKLIQKIDQNKSGKIDFQQFLVCMTDNEMMRNKNCIREAFEFFDEDHTGYIERKELIDCLEGCEEEEIVKLIKQADFNGDGKISPDQFMRYLMTVQI